MLRLRGGCTGDSLGDVTLSPRTLPLLLALPLSGLLLAGPAPGAAPASSGTPASATLSAVTPPAAPVAAAAPKYGKWGFDYATMDRSVRPGDDFFRYTEGTWLRNAPIDPDKSRAGYNYDLPDVAERDVHAIVDDAEKNPTAPMSRQIGDFYAAWMDQAGIEARGTAPLKPYLARIDAIRTRGELVQLMAEPSYAGPIGIWIGPA